MANFDRRAQDANARKDARAAQQRQAGNVLTAEGYRPRVDVEARDAALGAEIAALLPGLDLDDTPPDGGHYWNNCPCLKCRTQAQG